MNPQQQMYMEQMKKMQMNPQYAQMMFQTNPGMMQMNPMQMQMMQAAWMKNQNPNQMNTSQPQSMMPPQMSAPPKPPTPKKEYLRVKLGNDERGFYASMWSIVNPHEDRKISMNEGKKFLEKSGLNEEIINQIWRIAAQRDETCLEKEEFYVALRLVAYAQNHQDISPQSIKINLQVALPKIDLSKKEEQPQSLPTTPQIPTSQYAITHEEKMKYFRIFENFDVAKKGYLNEQQAQDIFTRTKLPQNILANVWELVVDDRNILDKQNFSIGMHLLALQKKGIPIPPNIPPDLHASIFGPSNRPTQEQIIEKQISSLLEPKDIPDFIESNAGPKPMMNMNQNMGNNSLMGAFDIMPASSASNSIQHSLPIQHSQPIQPPTQVNPISQPTQDNAGELDFDMMQYAPKFKNQPPLPKIEQPKPQPSQPPIQNPVGIKTAPPKKIGGIIPPLENAPRPQNVAADGVVQNLITEKERQIKHLNETKKYDEGILNQYKQANSTLQQQLEKLNQELERLTKEVAQQKALLFKEQDTYLKTNYEFQKKVGTFVEEQKQLQSIMNERIGATRGNQASPNHQPPPLAQPKVISQTQIKNIKPPSDKPSIDPFSDFQSILKPPEKPLSTQNKNTQENKPNFSQPQPQLQQPKPQPQVQPKPQPPKLSNDIFSEFNKTTPLVKTNDNKSAVSNKSNPPNTNLPTTLSQENKSITSASSQEPPKCSDQKKEPGNIGFTTPSDFNFNNAAANPPKKEGAGFEMNFGGFVAQPEFKFDNSGTSFGNMDAPAFNFDDAAKKEFNFVGMGNTEFKFD